MRKLKLDLDDLAVESFAPASVRNESGGTVHAHDATRNANTCNNFSCQAGCTFQESCYNPCATG
ncbi:hypothetical protein [Longimicrobium sp.]|uniref:hypothetical protein n=1 Tax=Longimicrobium sp. TaxID=2029185 RepID=UPI002BBD7653|nr:hypothetical protein [Longimicrobium sp.]HSU12528.1 hypothetical protein [Longimicrobium sp.]